MQTTIAIDAMGGDNGPSATIPAAMQFLGRSNDYRVLLVGKPEVIHAELKRAHSDDVVGRQSARLKIVEATEVVGMDEDIRSAIRNKKIPQCALQLTW